ncbi:Cof-type HAD-IIB family hydrolase [Thalassobacillus devorans]|uniref:Cof-type HAD-IIB family hydrolase n=1 Tax=Thalassobacillus devorans TaxID=279813 RepID=UPI000A1CA458|nr:Cof-type HAD-IIB family hydrolase [Thalassobacillus devorans]
MIKLFVSDLDGTLLGMNHFIKEKDKSAIDRLVKRGVDLAVASGRMDHEIRDIFERIGQKGHRISQNGAFVYGADNSHILAETFDAEVVRQVYRDLVKEPMVTTVSTAEETFTHQHNEWIDLISEQLIHDIQVNPELADALGVEVDASKITVHGKEPDVMALQRKIDEKYSQKLDCFVSHETCVDLVPKGINKASGLQALFEQTGLKSEQIAVIGDSFNDIPMFQLAPHSYAMSNAHPEVQKQAAHVVDHVYEAIDDLESKKLI